MLKRGARRRKAAVDPAYLPLDREDSKDVRKRRSTDSGQEGARRRPRSWSARSAVGLDERRGGMTTMTVRATEIPDVLIITPARHGDARGFLSETYNKQRFAAHGIGIDFVQDNHSFSA